jgi:hypothetical protein
MLKLLFRSLLLSLRGKQHFSGKLVVALEVVARLESYLPVCISRFQISSPPLSLSLSLAFL